MKKSIFITGGSSGIGLATAQRFKKAGYQVGICGRDFEKLKALENEFEIYQLDVRNQEDVKKAVLDFHEKYGLDIIFANAGRSYAHKSRIPDFQVGLEIIDININGTMYLFDVATKIMLEQGHGQLAATASVAGLNGLPGVSAYSASKSAVIKLCESLGMDLKQDGISVTCIIPGFVDTPLTQVNPHPMPFMISAETAGEKVYQGIINKKQNVYFPFLFAMVVRFLSVLPRPLFTFIMGIKIFNYSKQD